ncbi:MAG: extracellular solute-binding protein [Minisyncoccia bacterium]
MNKKLLMIIGIIGGVVIFGLIVFLLLKSLNPNKTTSAVLQFWGVYDDPSYYTDIINQYQKDNPGVKIVYQEFTYDEYENKLIQSFASGTGPDIWLIDNTWLPKHGDLMAPMPATIPGLSQPLITIQDFQNQFADVAATDLVYNNQIYAMPLYIDTLALYYNKDIFNSAGVAVPPTTWDQFNNDVKLLTQLDSTGHITRAGAAIGTAQNINRGTDLLMLLMMQSGVQMTSNDDTSVTFSQPVQNQNVGEAALQYYTDFANPLKEVYTWDDLQSYSVDAFTASKVAMMFDYSHEAQVLHAEAPRFNFNVAPMPQVSGATTAVNFANYWAVAVSKQSKNINEAWKFVAALTNATNATKYLNISGRPAARRDLISAQESDPDIGVFAKQALSARTWYQVDSSAIETIFANMIDAVNHGRASIHDAIQTAESQVNVLMQKNK